LKSGSMHIFIPRETNPQETRIPLLGEDCGKMVQLGAEVEVEAGIGQSLNIPDTDYETRGAGIANDRQAALSAADVVLHINALPPEDIRQLKQGSMTVSHLDAFNEAALIRQLCSNKISAISLDMLPRTTIAQKMDVLSSQASLAGYAAVLLAAQRLQKIFPMMMTPAGTISPARVFVIGAGVAGLQAIATAKRLGARVDAFDVRPEAQEQILSLGAKPLKIDVQQSGKTRDGYAKQLSEEQLAIQRKAMAKQCAQSDVVITTARVFGKKAPLIVTNDMLDGMKPGSVVVDLAVETGGNVESSEYGKEITRNGVMIIGLGELQRQVPLSASRMFSSNLYNFVEHFWDKEAKRLVLNQDDEIIKGCLITHGGQILNASVRKALEKE
jgi:NAD(P) transhydrogenase subunit alpha